MTAASLDPSSGVPLYRQIKEILREEIVSGSADQVTPITEALLLERFPVSRAPIRQALKELADEGYVYRRQGKGTFPVTGARVDRPADVRPGDLSRYLEERGKHPVSTVSDVGFVEPSPRVRAKLAVGPQEKVLEFTRLIAADNQKFALARVSLKTPHGFTPTAAELVDSGSVFALLEHRLGLTIERSEHETWATAATEAQAEALELTLGTPLLMIDSLFFAKGGLPIGFRSAAHRPDDFKYAFVVQN